MKDNKERTGQEILNAASRRFGHYGYSKTTMAEIAKDCSMSAANIYRYFRDKSAIGAAIASRCFETESGLLRAVAARPDLTSTEKVSEFILTSVRYNFQEFRDSPEIMELVEHICTEGTGLINSHKEVTIGILADILAEGVKNDEFEIEDLKETATSIHIATLIFHATPLFLMFKNHCATVTEMEGMAKQVVQLIVKGIGKG